MKKILIAFLFFAFAHQASAQGTDYLVFHTFQEFKDSLRSYVASADDKYVKTVVLNTPGVIFSSPVTFTTSNNTSTGSLSLVSQAANLALMSPNGASGSPTFRALVAADIPALPYEPVQSGTGYIKSAAGVKSYVTAIANADLANSTISGIALGSSLGALTATNTTLTFSGTYDGSAARTIGLNLAAANTWSAAQTFSAGITVGNDINTTGNPNLGSAANYFSSVFSPNFRGIGVTTLRSGSASNALVFALGTTTVGSFTSTTQFGLNNGVSLAFGTTGTVPADPASGNAVLWFDGTNLKVKKNVGGTISSAVIY